MGWSLIIKYRL